MPSLGLAQHGDKLAALVLGVLMLAGVGHSVNTRGELPALKRDWGPHIDELVAAGELERAQDELRAAVEIECLDAWAPRWAQVAQMRGDVEGELRALNRVVRAQPSAAMAWVRMAQLHIERAQPGDLELALDAAKRAVEAQETPQTRAALARVHEARGESEDAKRELERARQLAGPQPKEAP